MKQNKVEAIREQGIAEKMVASKDYMGARDKLLKAQQLYPELDNIVSMLTVCDILCAANIKFPGSGIDCYWVLQLLPSASDSDIKARYRKLLNLLQPIRNKFQGTEMALKHIRDAYFVLTEREKRSAFDSNRHASWARIRSLSLQASPKNDTTNKESVATAQSSSGYKRVPTSDILSESSGEGVSREMLLKNITDLGPTNPLDSCNIDKQWEKGDPPKGSFSASMNSKANGGIDRSIESISSSVAMHSAVFPIIPPWPSKDVSRKGANLTFYNFENNRKAASFEVGQIWAAHYRANVPHRYARINMNLRSEMSVIWLKPVPVTAEERRWCEAGLPVACGSFDLDPEMSEQKVSRPMVFSHMCSWVHGVTEEQFEIYPKKGEVWAMYKDWDLSEWSSNPETMEGCRFEIVELLTDYSKYVGAVAACMVKIEGFRSVYQRCTLKENQSSFDIPPNNLYMFSHNVPAFRFMGGEMDGIVEGMFELDLLALPDDMAQDIVIPELPKAGSSSDLSSFTNHSEQVPSVKTYPEIQCLKPTWSGNDFVSGQIWAVYSGTDFMPRRYAQVNNVVSTNQVCVTFLEPQPILDYEIQWQKENLPIVTGIFRVGKTTLNLEMSWFSHTVKCQRSTTKSFSFFKIYPMKGEIWAMYKNCNNRWKQSDYHDYQCRIVEILSDFSEGKLMRIARLVEVKGCLTFFQRQQFDGFELTRTVSKTDMLSFSHRIRAFTVPGVGRYGITEGSWHLEPDALPPKRGN